MKPDDFDFLSRFLKDSSGLVLGAEKSYLLESRLTPLVRKWKLKDLDDLVGETRKTGNKELRRDVVEAMTTNESFFFRDSRPFDQFRDIVLPHLLKARASSRRIRILCAACSSGQEPYSLAMLLEESRLDLKDWQIDIIGTDISTEMLDKARKGLYSQFEVQRGLPVKLLVKYFEQVGDRWQIASRLRERIQYRYSNLLEDTSELGRFDVIFLRNVLIYFDQQTKTDVLGRISRQLAPDGFLYLGGAETVLGVSDRLALMPGQRGIYCLKEAAKAAVG
ncbi:CheR family methyltransferase [Fodinicurvata halophila]|uniref:protein-glutamate O-methyltransferase n=1 Tax=Fodinicurvata halophila TaxID=1419723 RepID=A0ABV8ULR4_9PROT